MTGRLQGDDKGTERGPPWSSAPHYLPPISPTSHLGNQLLVLLAYFGELALQIREHRCQPLGLTGRPPLHTLLYALLYPPLALALTSNAPALGECEVRSAVCLELLPRYRHFEKARLGWWGERGGEIVARLRGEIVWGDCVGRLCGRFVRLEQLARQAH